MKVSVVTVVKDEAFLIAKHLCHLASLGDEVICYVQPSCDGTLMIAETMCGQIDVPLKVIPHVPRTIVPEDSLNGLPQDATYDWCMYLNADESYQGRHPSLLADEIPDPKYKAVGFPRWHAVVADNDKFFKVEEWNVRRRLFHKSMVGNVEFRVHSWSMTQQLQNVSWDVSKEVGRIIEYKAAWQHYRRQLFWEKTAKAGSDRILCEDYLPQVEKDIGRMIWKRDHNATVSD